MDVFDAIKWRRSVRSYDGTRDVEDWKIKRLLEAARLAPSGKNRQVTRFVLIRSPENRRKAAVMCNHQSFIADAPVLIAAVSVEPEAKMGSGTPAHRIDAAIALEHIVLEATELGLGTCWIGAYDKKSLSNFLEIPDDCELIALLAVGYPKEIWRPHIPHRKPLDELVFYEKFGERS